MNGKEYVNNPNYTVFDNGTIYSKPNFGNHQTGMFLKMTVDANGYPAVKLYPEKKTFRVHRLVAETFIPNPNNYPQVNHIDGNKQNNSVENLEWCTNTHNFQHANETGLICYESRPRGIKHGRAKISEDDVRFIRTNYLKGSNVFGTQAMARRFDLDPATILSILRRDIWKHV